MTGDDGGQDSRGKSNKMIALWDRIREIELLERHVQASVCLVSTLVSCSSRVWREWIAMRVSLEAVIISGFNAYISFQIMSSTTKSISNVIINMIWREDIPCSLQVTKLLLSPAVSSFVFTLHEYLFRWTCISVWHCEIHIVLIIILLFVTSVLFVRVAKDEWDTNSYRDGGSCRQWSKRPFVSESLYYFGSLLQEVL
jgi:hypothetical protein